MFKSSLDRLAVRKGWTRDDSFIVRGEWEQCPVSLVDGEGFIEIILPLPTLSRDSESWDTMQSAIDNAGGGVRVMKRDIVEGFLAIRIERNLFKKPSVDALDLFLNVVVEQANQLDLIVPHVCAICQEPTEESGTLFDLACHIHPACKESVGDSNSVYPLFLQYEDRDIDPFRFLKIK